MKKTVYILFMVLFLTGISVYWQNAADLSGKYYLSSMELDGYAMDEEMMSLMGINSTDCYIEFLANGKCLLCMNDDISEGEYKVDGKALSIIDDEGTTDFGEINGNIISISSDEFKMVFAKK